MAEVAEEAPALNSGVIGHLGARFGSNLRQQTTVDGIPTVWVPRNLLIDILRELKTSPACAYEMLFDISVVLNHFIATID